MVSDRLRLLLQQSKDHIVDMDLVATTSKMTRMCFLHVPAVCESLVKIFECVGGGESMDLTLCFEVRGER